MKKPPTTPLSEETSALAQLVGQSVNAIDTPALVLDLEALGRLPAENATRAPRYARPGPARSASCPAATEPITLASRHALTAQP